jgi:hypothetical protein
VPSGGPRLLCFGFWGLWMVVDHSSKTGQSREKGIEKRVRGAGVKSTNTRHTSRRVSRQTSRAGQGRAGQGRAGQGRAKAWKRRQARTEVVGEALLVVLHAADGVEVVGQPRVEGRVRQQKHVLYVCR